MRIYVKVNPNSSQNKVKKITDGEYKIWTTATPEKNKANKMVIKLLAKYFDTSQNQIKIIIGKTTRKKIIDITL
jgi:uncharacterized protein (TIGR00251 family)